MARIPSRGSDQFVVRFPEGMRDRIKQIADRNGRSMNAEIISRLEASFTYERKIKASDAMRANPEILSTQKLIETLRNAATTLEQTEAELDQRLSEDVARVSDSQSD